MCASLVISITPIHTFWFCVRTASRAACIAFLFMCSASLMALLLHVVPFQAPCLTTPVVDEFSAAMPWSCGIHGTESKRASSNQSSELPPCTLPDKNVCRCLPVFPKPLLHLLQISLGPTALNILWKFERTARIRSLSQITSGSNPVRRALAKSATENPIFACSDP